MIKIKCINFLQWVNISFNKKTTNFNKKKLKKVRQYKNREILLIPLNRTIKVHWIDKSEQQAQETKINKKTNHSVGIEHHQ